MSAISRVSQISQVHLVELKNVCFPRMKYPCKCFMELLLDEQTNKMSIEPAPHPCLVVTEQPNGPEVFLDALVVVPADAPASEPFQDCLYAAALRAIRRTYSKTTGRVFTGRNPKRPLFDFRDISWEEPPFACAQHASKKVKCWSPLVLRQGYMSTNRRDDWYILNSWKNWQMNAISFIERKDQFYSYVEGFKANQRTGMYSATSKQASDAFRKRLAEIGLPSTAKALTGKSAVVLTRKQRYSKALMKRPETPVKFSDLPKPLFRPDNFRDPDWL